jgi:hypothetical protein
MREPGKPARCQAVVTVKRKRCRCDQPATVERGEHAGCVKHDRGVWIEYAQPALPMTKIDQRDGACGGTATKLFFLHRNRSFSFYVSPGVFLDLRTGAGYIL